MKQKMISRTVTANTYEVKGVDKNDKVIHIDYETPQTYREGKELDDFKEDAETLIKDTGFIPIQVKLLQSVTELRKCTEADFIAISKPANKEEN